MKCDITLNGIIKEKYRIKGSPYIAFTESFERFFFVYSYEETYFKGKVKWENNISTTLLRECYVSGSVLDALLTVLILIVSNAIPDY